MDSPSARRVWCHDRNALVPDDGSGSGKRTAANPTASPLFRVVWDCGSARREPRTVGQRDSRRGSSDCRSTDDTRGQCDSYPQPMARMHTRRRGSSGSDKPSADEPPVERSDVDSDDIEARVVELAEQGHDPSQIGMKLRDEGVTGTPVPDVKLATGKKITEILEENDAKSEFPEDLRNLMIRAVRLREHVRENQQDFQNKRALQNTEAKVRRLVKVLPRRRNRARLPVLLRGRDRAARARGRINRMSTEGRSAEPASATTSALESARLRPPDRPRRRRRTLAARAASSRARPRRARDAVPGDRRPNDRGAIRARPGLSSGEDDATILVGAANAAETDDFIRLAAASRPATLEAVDLVRGMGATPDPVLALAGVVAGGANPVPARASGSSRPRTNAASSNSDRASRCRPPIRSTDSRTRHASTHRGRAIPTQRAKRSRTPPMATPPTSMRTITVRSGSLVALDVVGADGAADAAASSIGRTLRPFATPDGPFATLGGFADVLEALARTEPGTETARDRDGTRRPRGGTRCLARARTPRSRCTRGRLDRTLRRPVRRRDRRRSRRSGRADCGGLPVAGIGRSPSTRDTVPRAIGRSPMTETARRPSRPATPTPRCDRRGRRSRTRDRRD